MSTDIDYNEVSSVISSDYRQAVVLSLLDGFKTPSEISEDTGKAIAHISRAIKYLREELELVELLVDDDKKKGRLYALTEEGETIAKAVESRGRQ